MSDFAFRLQKVFEYRELEEQWAKDHLLACMARIAEVEDEAVRIETMRKEAISSTEASLMGRQQLENLLATFSIQESGVRSLVRELESEAEEARQVWFAKRKEKAALETLRDKAYEEWRLESERRIQRELDEWAVMRRSAA
jgi:flagellar export protein FliJ